MRDEPLGEVVEVVTRLFRPELFDLRGVKDGNDVGIVGEFRVEATVE